ncbi:MAG: amidohydrolase family protein [Sphingomonas sp.]
MITSPTAADTPALLEKFARENRISGVRWTGAPDKEGNYVFLTDAAAPAWEAADRLGLVVVLMPIGGSMPPTMKRVGEYAAKYPNINIVLDHIGFPRPEGGPNFGLSPEHRALTQHRTSITNTRPC